MTDLRTPILSLALVGVLALSLAGCSAPVSDDTAGEGTTTSDETATDDSSAAESAD